VNDWPQLALFNPFDWAVVVVLVLSALLSLWRGFVREALSLASWVLAFLLANLFALAASRQFEDLIVNPTGRYIVAWSGLFVLVLVLGSLASRLLSKLVQVTGLSLLDRILGSVFGLLRGALIVLAVVFILRQLIPESELALLRDAQLMPHIDLLLAWTARLFEDFRGTQIGGITL